jgi:hypothetical protein
MSSYFGSDSVSYELRPCHSSGGWLVFSLGRLRFSTRTVHVGYVVDRVALGLVFLQALWVLHISYSTSAVFSCPASEADRESTCNLSIKILKSHSDK